MKRLAGVPKDSATDPCCCEPDCCMYSATALAAGDLVAADLPDAITLLGVGSLSRSGTSYGDTTNGVIFETDTWAKYITTDDVTVRTVFDCLIRGDGKFTVGDDAVEDQFEATYSVSVYNTHDDSLIDTFTVTRYFLCGWISERSGPEDTWVSLNYSGSPFPDSWDCNYAVFSGSYEYPSGEPMFDALFAAKEPFLNSPVGQYPEDTTGYWVYFIVS